MQDTYTQEVRIPKAVSLARFRPFLNASLSSFKDIFLLRRDIIGLDIGSSFIKIVRLERRRKSYTLADYLLEEIPQSVKEKPDEKKRYISERIKDFIKGANYADLRLAIWDKRVFIFSFNLPKMKRADLRGAVSIDLKRRLPLQLDLHNVSFGYFVAQEFSDEKGLALSLTCIAVENQVIQEELGFFKEMDLGVSMINVLPDALGNLLSFCFAKEPKELEIALLDLGDSASLLNFYKAGNLIFSREISVGAQHLNQALVKGIGVVLGRQEVSFEVAEKIKQDNGIPLEDEANKEYLSECGALRGEQISALLRPVLERLVTEINRTLIYYTKTFKAANNIEELYLTGGGAHLKNMDKFLLCNLSGLKKVEKLNTLAAIDSWQYKGSSPQGLPMEETALYLGSALGICLGKGGKINLLPAKEKLEQAAIFFAQQFKIFFPFILGLLFIFYAFIYVNSLRYKSRISNLEARFSKVEPVANQVKACLAMRLKLGQIKGFLEAEKKKHPLWCGLLKELSSITPDEVILQRITSLPEIQPKEIRLAGRVYARYNIVDVALSQYLMVLGESPYFSQINLVSSKTDMYSVVPVADFEISAKLRY